ncbi:MAG: SURF1 family protein [Pseudomonadota bacterium]
MLRRAFNIVCVGGAIAVLIAMGVWQLQRLAWKQDLISQLEARGQQPAIALPFDLTEPEALEFAHFTVAGQFDPVATLYLVARSGDGEAGFRLLSPFKRLGEDADPGWVLVDRGWIPFEAGKAELPPPEGVQELTGMMRVMRKANAFLPDNDVDANTWYGLNELDLRGHLGFSVGRFYLVQTGDGQGAGEWPRKGDLRIDVRNEHLQYALTWFALAMSLVVVVLIRRRQK